MLEILKERSRKSEGKLVDQQQQEGEGIREKKRVEKKKEEKEEMNEEEKKEEKKEEEDRVIVVRGGFSEKEARKVKELGYKKMEKKEGVVKIDGAIQVVLSDGEIDTSAHHKLR